MIPKPPATGPAASDLPQIYHYQHYLLRRKMLVLLGARIDIYGPDEKPILCCFQKAFKLKEDITLYADESKRVELLRIKARQVIDFSAAYDVTDAQTGQMVGTLRRKGISSMVRDSWEILNPGGQLIARIQEDSLGLALLRRLMAQLIMNLIPQRFDIKTPNGQVLAEARQRFNPFIHRMDLTMPRSTAQWSAIDPRLVLAASLLLVLIESRQR